MAHPLWDIGLHWFGKGTAFTPTGYAVAYISFDLFVAAYLAGTLLGLFNLRRQKYES